MKMKFLTQFFDELPESLRHIGITYPRFLTLLEAGCFFGKIQFLKRIILNRTIFN